jgi:putative ABC transport system permease protein
VILLLAVGNGSAQRVQSAIANLGTNTLTVRASNGGSSTTSSSVKTITRTVGDQIASAGLGHVKSVVPEVNTSLTVSSTTTSSTSVSIIGTTPDYFGGVSTSTVASGKSFTADDVTNGTRAAVIGSELASTLFPTGSALGQQILIDGSPFDVVGILAAQSSTGFNDPNLVVVAPISRIQESFTGYGAVSTLAVEATSSDAVTAAEGEVTVMLNQLLGVTNTADEPFTVTSASTLLATAETSAASFTVLLGAVAAISLLVGGIGVTNVMLVTVTERTREIGIRKAIGAPRGAILGQFLTEAVIVSVLGGLLGVGFGILVAQFKIDGVTPVISTSSVLEAFGVSTAIGIFFGFYPANRAAGLRPIDALRYE